MACRFGATAVGMLAGLGALAGITAVHARDTGNAIEQYSFSRNAGCHAPLEAVGDEVKCTRIDGREGVRLGDDSYLQTDGSAFDRPSLSISLWLYLERNDRDEMRLVMRDRGELLQRVFQLQVHNPRRGYGESRIRFLAETRPGGGWEIALTTETGVVLPGSWHHVVVTVAAGEADLPGVARIWVNGRQERVRAESGGGMEKRSLSALGGESKSALRSDYQVTFPGVLLSNPSVPLIIGSPGAGRYTFQGIMGDLRLFDHALDRNEIRQLYRLPD